MKGRQLDSSLSRDQPSMIRETVSYNMDTTNAYTTISSAQYITPCGISRYGQVHLQHRERGINPLLPLLTADDGVSQAMPLLWIGSLSEAGERLTDNGIQLGPNVV